MKNNLKSYGLLGGLLLGGTVVTSHAQLLPISCGAESTNTGTPLVFVNSNAVSVTSGFVQPLTYQRVANRYGTNIYYASTNLLFTALSVKTNAATSAGFGSYIACEVVSVDGPAGGVFYFWEQGNGRPTYSFPVGGTYATNKNRFVLSNCENGAGRPDGDPFGAVRGRRFVVNKTGEYLVTFKLYDTSVNHPTTVGAPIHAPSEPLTIKFATGVDLGITALTVTNGPSESMSTLVYRHGALTNLLVEASTNLTSWTPVMGPFTNVPISLLSTNVFTNTLQTPYVFYRLNGVLPP